MSQYTAADGSLWRIEFVNPPIPVRCFDWRWMSVEYDGPGDPRIGHVPSREGAEAAVEEWVADDGGAP